MERERGRGGERQIDIHRIREHERSISERDSEREIEREREREREREKERCKDYKTT